MVVNRHLSGKQLHGASETGPARSGETAVAVSQANSHADDFGSKPLYSLIADTARTDPQRICIHYGGRNLTYAEVDEASSRFASSLASLGVKKGDRVAIVLPNIPQFVISYFGIMKAGGIVVACSMLYKPKELEYQLKDSGASVIVTVNDVIAEKSLEAGKAAKSYKDLFENVQICKDRLGIDNVITTSVTDYLPAIKRRLAGFAGVRKLPRPGTMDFCGLLRSGNAIKDPVAVDPSEDLALLQYTGGTTGVSKGAMLTHLNLYSNAACVSSLFPMTKDDVSLCVLPLFHIYGMTVTMNSALVAGAKLVLLPSFHVEEVMKAIQKQKVTLFCAVPAMYIAINGNPNAKRFDLHSVRACLSGGAAMPSAVRKQFMDLTGASLVEGYGLTEASPVALANPVQGGKAKDLSVGIPVTGTEVVIVDMEDPSKIMPAGEIGELAIRGPQVMKGYWNKNEETENVLRDGLLLTGDIARMDEEGYFYIVDRKKDMVNVGGLKVYPRDVEEVLFGHPAVREAAVVAVPDSFSGEAVKAFVILNDPKAQVSEKELIDFCATTLARYKVPKTIEFVDELPKTLIGKILRRELRDQGDREHTATS